MKQMGWGKDYRSAHDSRDHFDRELSYLPETLIGRKYYAPGSLGHEAEAAERLRAKGHTTEKLLGKK